ncbi:uroporphyrinogen-III C-methyltransferase [Bacillus canaveralius]|uniref:Uroporphyrinogen-III C-methyltransferase n=2 Tax=Bacillus canaveralius TaxID=1403243 RepID=A0A2N5GME4_9BACI|nr:uroporphyrinogen-III C-methyltransferase [Bacillus canaveralius]PLR83026.1 uroporphyrinogen-III C-methyltransferase [Bacillus canaveralius]PLR96970.1 uroporphyrinogen-III C-methyltransferase [Bacillus canaveralius]
MVGTVYLVGAGPGDPELITLKGLHCIQQADIILYDRLVNPELLKHAHKDAQLIYCGKLPHYHTMKQETINHFLVKYAKEGLRVVRLKGGDPFVFGRGGEEALECAKNDIPFEIVPGITAGIAATAYAGIPVTHRTLSKSFAFITGHQAGDIEAEHQWAHLANAVDTICIYMGVHHLPAITKQLIQHGKRPDTPIALVQWGTLNDQRTITGTLETIEKRVKEADISNPSMIVIGEVVRLHKKLNWFKEDIAPHIPVALA